jgi:hypothetical protein
MPVLESLPVTVKLIIEVDGHTLTFIEEGKATGGRRADLEETVRGSIDTMIARVHRKAMQFADRAWSSWEGVGDRDRGVAESAD